MTRAYRISALVKCHNEELFLRQCIESIRPLVNEIVVVDNNSTDSSREIAMQLGVKVVDFAGDPGGSIGLADYYNWCDDTTSGDYIVKWDADVVALDSFAEALSLLERLPEAVCCSLYNLRCDHRHLWSRNPLCGPEPYIYRRTCRYVSAPSGIERLRLTGQPQRYPDPVGLHLNLKSDERYFLRNVMCRYRAAGGVTVGLEAWARQVYPDYQQRVQAEGLRALHELIPYEGPYPSELDSYLANPKWLVEYVDGKPSRRIERW
jgi:glycosyltransferase involved in cell wall biosynthesis